MDNIQHRFPVSYTYDNGSTYTILSTYTTLHWIWCNGSKLLGPGLRSEAGYCFWAKSSPYRLKLNPADETPTLIGREQMYFNLVLTLFTMTLAKPFWHTETTT